MKTDKKKKTGGRTTRGPAPRKKGAPAAKKRAGARKGAPAKKPKQARRKEAPAGEKIGPPENPKARALAKKIAGLVADKKALDVVVLDVRGIASYADYVVIASGESDRQVTAMAENVQQKLKQEDGLNTIGSEGTETGQWVLLDYGDVVAHLFNAEVRGHYDLEGLWADAPREAVS